MSYKEYTDLFIKSQITGKYHVFIFDIIDSKKMDKEKRYSATIKLHLLADLIYSELKKEEQKRNKKILVYEEGFSSPNTKKLTEFGLKTEPFYLGDLFGFTIYRDSMKEEEILSIYSKYKNQLEIEFDFHYASGYYETNNWIEASEKYFRGHCIQQLSELHKKENKKILLKLKKVIM